jgi:Flp pilus assembly protein TadG
MATRWTSAALRLLRRFFREERAIAAVEFALLSPVALALMAGAVDLTQALAVKRKLIEIAYTVSDLVAQRSEITQADVNSILTGSAAILLPYDTANLDIVLAVLDITNGKNIVNWSAASGTTAPAKGSELKTVTVPAKIVISGVQVVSAQVSYNYKPPFSSLFGTSLGMDSSELSRPRGTKVISLN